MGYERAGGSSSPSFFRERRRFRRNVDGKIAPSLFTLALGSSLRQDAVCAFLTIGYVPGMATLFDGISCHGADDVVDGQLGDSTTLTEFFEHVPDRDHSPEILKNALREVIERRFIPGARHIVPLSGGMDSRIVLAALLEFTEASSIETYSFGVPGAYDFDIPARVAKSIGTRHTSFTDADTTYTVDGLIRAAVQSDGNTEIFNPIVLNRVVETYGRTGAIYWSGFAGDLVGGGFSSEFDGGDPKTWLLERERHGSLRPHSGSDCGIIDLITSGSKMQPWVSPPEACFWENHVERYTAHHIFRNDMMIEAPLVDMQLLKFFFTLADHNRHDKQFFKQFFRDALPGFAPHLSSFPTKDYGYLCSRTAYKHPLHQLRFYVSATLWRLLPAAFTHPRTAYIDMRHAINHRKDVRSCVDLLLDDFCKRDIVDRKRIRTILDLHRSGSANHAQDIILAASLEVILKASGR